MILPQVSNDFLNIFLKSIDNIKETKLTKQNKQILSDFYKLLKKHEINAEKVVDISIKKTIIEPNNKESIINNFSFLKSKNIFLSERIQKNILSNIKSLNTFKIKIGTISFTINIFLFKNGNVEEMKVKIIRLLYFISNFITNRKLRTLEINLILTNLKKELPPNPKEVLNTYHINTGVTWSCKPEGEIVVYREEEWFKVLIHELFHSVCFDFSKLNMDKLIKEKITKMFFIKNSTFSITETYCEFWANIINSVIMAYEITDNYNDFKKKFELFNTFEKYFSIFQCIKVLNHMNLNYEIIISNLNVYKELSIQNYNEKTNVLGYFIVKMIWLFYSNEMLTFFSINNKENIINSGKTYVYLSALINKTSELYKKKELLDGIYKYSEVFSQLTMGLPLVLSTNVDLLRSLRMTVIEIN